MNKIPLDFYLEPPELTATGTLTLDALAPLSMVDSQPGTYFRTADHPSNQMVYGLLENALGWHFPDKTRKEILKELAKRAKKIYRKDEKYQDSPWLSGKPQEVAGSNYFSLLQYHLELDIKRPLPEVLAYDDLWSMHLRDRGMNYVGGSRNYDDRLERLISRLRNSSKEEKTDKFELGDRTGFEKIPLDQVYTTDVRKIHTLSIREGYPMYYVSPKKRGFVVPDNPYQFSVRITKTLANLFDHHLQNPQAPAYLGTSEGWTELKWNRHD